MRLEPGCATHFDARRVRVLVTGGAGFIGSHLVRLLTDQGCAVRVFDLPAATTASLPKDVERAYGDIRHAHDVRRATEDCQVVLHLAANPNLWAPDAAEFDRVNHQGTRHALEAARACQVQRFVHVSTESILATRTRAQAVSETTTTQLADMVGPYCRSKWQAEDAAAEAARSGLPVVIVNPTVPVGPGDHRLGPLSRLICQFASGQIKAKLDGQINLIDVRDVAAGIWAAALRGQTGNRYLLAGENWTIGQLFQALSQLTHQPAPRWAVPYWLALSFARIEEIVCRRITGKLPMATVTGVKLTRHCFEFDGSATARELDLDPLRPAYEALRDAVEWFEARGLIHRNGHAQRGHGVDEDSSSGAVVAAGVASHGKSARLGTPAAIVSAKKTR